MNELRKEWNRIKTEISLGNACYNCGSEENIELHHIVPLKLGGSNNITNIAVLCHKCHMAAHYGRHMNEYKNKPKEQKQKQKPEKKITYKKKIALTIPDYISGKITEDECKEILGIGKEIDLKRMKFYKKYAK